MGAGKSTVGRALAERSGVVFHDLDSRIEAVAGRSIAAIFADEGESTFRKREADVLRELGADREFVMATGGGLPVDPANRVWIRRRGFVIWLDTPFELAMERIEGDERRPLLGPIEEARRLFERRRPAYEECDLRLPVEAGTTVDEVVDRVLEALRNRDLD